MLQHVLHASVMTRFLAEVSTDRDFCIEDEMQGSRFSDFGAFIQWATGNVCIQRQNPSRHSSVMYDCIEYTCRTNEKVFTEYMFTLNYIHLS